MGKNACDDTLHVARKRPCDIGYGFSLPKANLVLTKIYAVTSKLGDCDAEAHLRAKRWLFEQKREILASKGATESALFLHPCNLQYEFKFLRRHIGYREEIASAEL